MAGENDTTDIQEISTKGRDTVTILGIFVGLIMFGSLVCFSVYLIKLKKKDNIQVNVLSGRTMKEDGIVYYEDDGSKSKIVRKDKWADLPDGISDVQSVTDQDNRSAYNKTKSGSEYNHTNGNKP